MQRETFCDLCRKKKNRGDFWIDRSIAGIRLAPRRERDSRERGAFSSLSLVNLRPRSNARTGPFLVLGITLSTPGTSQCEPEIASA